MTASMTDSGDRRSLIATFTPSSFSSSRRPTIIGRFTTRVTVASIVSSSAAAAVSGRPLDGLDRVAVHLGREQQARADGGAVNDDGARSAYAVLAAEVGAREVEVVAQKVRQGLAHLDGLLVGPSIDGDADRPLDHRRSPVAPRPPVPSAA